MLLQIRDYIADNKIVSLKHMGNTFNLQAAALQPMLNLLIKKGMIKNYVEQKECHRGCCQSNSSSELFCMVS